MISKTILVLIPLVLASSAYAQTQQEIDSFNVADANQDAHLTATEFRIFIDLIADAGQSTAQAVRLFGVYDYAFGITDTDGDGILSPHELQSAEENHQQTQ